MSDDYGLLNRDELWSDHDEHDKRFDDAASLAIAIRDEIVCWPGVESGSRQVGTPEKSSIDIVTDDGRCFVVVVTEVELSAALNRPVSGDQP